MSEPSEYARAISEIGYRLGDEMARNRVWPYFERDPIRRLEAQVVEMNRQQLLLKPDVNARLLANMKAQLEAMRRRLLGLEDDDER